MLFSTANDKDNPVLKISLTILILCLPFPAKSQAPFYWGIGIRLGWDIGADITLGPNLLVGVVEDVEFYQNLKIRPRASVFIGYALLLNFAFGLRLSPGFDLTYINHHTSIANLNVTGAFLFPMETINIPFD